MRANETGLHYGPSEIILKQQNPDGACILVGQVEDGVYSIFELERKLGIFWGLSGGHCGSFESGEYPLVSFLEESRTLLISRGDSSIEEVYFELNLLSHDGQFWWTDARTVSVKDEELILIDLYDELKDAEKDMLSSKRADYFEGRDAAGNVIFQTKRRN